VHESKVHKIKLLLEKYSMSPENTIFVTDTLGDIKEAQECNVPTLAVTWGFHARETLEKGNPTKIIDHFEELEPAIHEILK